MTENNLQNYRKRDKPDGMFRALASPHFPPFGSLRLGFPPVENKPLELAEVHLFTGINGAGKTRLLSLLTAMLGHHEPLQKRIKDMDRSLTIHATHRFPAPSDYTNWGNQFSASGSNCQWTQLGSMQQWVQNVPAFAYSGTPYLADASITVMADTPRPTRASCLAFTRPEDHSRQLLQAIANLKVQAAMDWMAQPDHTRPPSPSARIISALETTIADITGLPFSFTVTSYPKAALEISWNGVTMAFDSLPDGLRSVIGWLAHAVVMMDVWLQGKQDPLTAEAVFLLDEIDCLLHPAWQRRILPAFQRLFPKAQIFVTTHSPFVIASLNSGWIHALKMDPDGGVYAQEPLPAMEADNYISVVEDIMGVRDSDDPEIEQMLADFKAHRDDACHGNAKAEKAARQLAKEIGSRGEELEIMIRRELKAMERDLAHRATPQKAVPR